jgi:Cu2+-exporting ATPase
VAAIADKIKPTSTLAIRQLQEMGIETYMLTGDNKDTAEAIAKETGIHHFHAEMLPQGKADFIMNLQKEGKVVAMVGDGINDSSALATADVSIAMGQGSDIAMDVAKMTIISSDLTKIPQAIKLSKYCCHYPPKSILGIYLQPHWNTYCRRHTLSHQRLFTQSYDCRSSNGVEQ